MRILLTGGSASGKSTYAEKLSLLLPPPHYYIATMEVMDEEARKKVIRHQEMRAGKGFITIERPKDLGGLHFDEAGTILVECLCNLLANEMFDREGRMLDVYNKILDDLEELEKKSRNLILVTNEVGSDGYPYGPGTQAYIQLLGRLNRAFAARFDSLAELAAGIPLVLKGELP